MGNNLVGNPITVDTTAASLWTGTKYVKQAQWLDDAGDIAASDVLIITVNNATITVMVAAVGATVSTTRWQFGPFDKGVPWTNIGVTIPHGLLIIWIE
uniref:Uncharacterized protein n=1 Tax=viral metagenome TaxID=1070528 RepID=A0A6M3XJJ7_9ZZZZ